MHDTELRRIAELYGATEPDMKEVARRAYQEPLVPVAEIMARVVVLAHGRAM